MNTSRLPPPTQARVLLKIGALAVSDAGPVLAMAERALVDRRGIPRAPT